MRETEAAPDTVSGALRRAVADSGYSTYHLARVLGISQSTLSRFLNGGHGLSLELVDRLAVLLGHTLKRTGAGSVPPQRGRGRPPKPKPEMQ